MPFTAIDYKLFGPRQFSHIRRAALQVQQRGRAATPEKFAAQMRRHLQSGGVAADWSDAEHTRLLVGQLVWVQIIGADQEMEAVQLRLRETMHAQADVLIAYLLQIGPRLIWHQVQISERWLKHQPPQPSGGSPYA